MTSRMRRRIAWIPAMIITAFVVAAFSPGRGQVTPWETRVERWNTLWFPALIVTLVLAAAVAFAAWKLRQRQAWRTWQLLEEQRPDAARYLVFLHQRTRTDLERFGWRLHRPAFAPVPLIGVTFGPIISFWEAGHEGPTFEIAYSNIHETAQTTETGDWPKPSLALRFDDNPTPSKSRREARHRRDLILSLLDANRKPLAEDDLADLISRLQEKHLTR